MLPYDDIQIDNAFDWKKEVWSVETAPKIKLFLWKTFKGAISVGTNLVAHNIPIDPRCKRCGEPESSYHLLFQCSYAQQIWSLALYAINIGASGVLDLEQAWRISCNAKTLPPIGIPASQLTPWIIWHLWIARNNLVFNNKPASAQETLTKAMAAAREWSINQVKDTKISQTLIRPETTTVRTYLLQTDAAWNTATQRAGLGWTVKMEGETTASGLCSTFVGSALVAESMAVHAALQQCKEEGITRLRCESDSTQLIRALTSSSMNMEIYGIVSDILSLALSFDVISFHWISREKNREADFKPSRCYLHRL
ncbi:uncharacterized protein LOC103864847 [Brassica rapa]|uniref:uncharacterized protein LOC103864847 n=1 Tax=Brassica campestris TaxID=3711 RepID=UPI0004F13F77|nr:uncharacterized protein LOC103864847 [Brassica rapa]